MLSVGTDGFGLVQMFVVGCHQVRTAAGHEVQQDWTVAFHALRRGNRPRLHLLKPLHPNPIKA